MMLNTIATRWRLYPSGWKRFGYYCLYCNKRANQWATDDDLRDEHTKQCKRTQKRLKARTGLVRALEARHEAYRQNINS